MKATEITLQHFNGIKVGNFKCHACVGTRSGVEHTPVFTLIFLLKGSFRHNTFRQSNFLTSEWILFKKPGFDYEVIHEHYIHDDCFYIEFGEEVMDRVATTFSSCVVNFLKNKDQASLLFKSNPWTSFIIWYLHRGTRDSIAALEYQSLILDLIASVLGKNPSIASADNALHDSVDRAKQFIVENYAEDISIDDVAHAACVSPFHFSRTFKRNTNLSPHQFLLEVRLQNARKLLLDSTRNIAEVSYASGFPNPDYFVTLFKRKTGVTPSEFRSFGVEEIRS